MWLGAREHLTRIMQHVAGLTLKDLADQIGAVGA